VRHIQRSCLERFDATRLPKTVLGSLKDAIDQLHAGYVPVKQFVERNCVSQSLEGYTKDTQNVAVLKRARDQDLAVHPGQDIEYVVDDEKPSRERVALACEEVEMYDPDYYETELVKAVERSKIRRKLAETQVTGISSITETDF